MVPMPSMVLTHSRCVWPARQLFLAQLPRSNVTNTFLYLGMALVKRLERKKEVRMDESQEEEEEGGSKTRRGR